MEKVIYSNNGGMGIILTNECEHDYINREAIALAGSILIPDCHTDLNGLFINPIRYAGLLKNEESTTMCFHTGDDANMFETVKYYYCYFWLSEYRIVTKFSERTAREFIWKNGKWK